MTSLFKLLLAAAFLNAFSWIILIPIWQYPDEQAHFAQVQDLAELDQVPARGNNTSYEIAFSEEILGTQRDGLGNNKFTYHPEYKIDYSDSFDGPRESEIVNLPKSARTQLVKSEATKNPPLYYVLGSLAYKLFNGGSLFTRVFAVRALSIIFFLLTVILSYEIGKLIFEKNKILSLALPTLVVFKPMFVFSSTGVLPDTLTNLLFTLVLFLSLKILTGGLQTPTILSVTITIALGVLTRQQFLISVPVVLLAICYQIFKKGSNRGKSILSILIILILIYLAAARGTALPLISNLRIPEQSSLNFKIIFQPSFISYLSSFIRQSIAQTLPWYWGVYKWLSLTVPHVNYQLINRLITVAIFGILVKLGKSFLTRKVTQSDIVLLFLISSSAIYIIIFVIWDYFFYSSHGFSFGFQGRYFFPMVAFHLAILLTGLWQVLEIIFKKFAKYGLLLILFLMILFNDVSLSYVAVSYYDTSSVDIFIKQSSQYKPVIFKGNIIPLILLLGAVSQLIFVLNFRRFVFKQTTKS